ncbi:hypothetical protein AB835_11635 [Candidatus Endobugula sertula]|uniref:Phage major tail tube protein n=1 Tax=Candidatus Endobugula sertula TaxID=62101 RepID=A0A1D2QMU1_9GAMM|nr:hypothetical protein AB835_11635 [Candidatus Endobugula sertula]
MAEAPPEVFMGMNLFVNGSDWRAKVTKFQPSLPKPVTKAINSPGLLGEIEVNTSKWSKAEPVITIQGYVPELLGMVGDPASIEEPVTIIGVVGANEMKTVEVEISGLWKDTDLPEWADEANAENSFKIVAYEYQMKIEGKEVLYVDYERRIVRINGKDISADINKRLKA